VVIAIVKAGDFISSLYVISLAVIYVVVMIFIVKPFLKRIGDLYGSKDSIGKPVMAIFFFNFLICYRSNWNSCPFELYDGVHYARILLNSE
jgi:hypothetical protein